MMSRSPRLLTAPERDSSPDESSPWPDEACPAVRSFRTAISRPASVATIDGNYRLLYNEASDTFDDPMTPWSQNQSSNAAQDVHGAGVQFWDPSDPYGLSPGPVHAAGSSDSPAYPTSLSNRILYTTATETHYHPFPQAGYILDPPSRLASPAAADPDDFNPVRSNAPASVYDPAYPPWNQEDLSFGQLHIWTASPVIPIADFSGARETRGPRPPTPEPRPPRHSLRKKPRHRKDLRRLAESPPQCPNGHEMIQMHRGKWECRQCR
ncbi:hypothetical protein BJ170DRAFT_499911 [Xylariales sp. AK1849]|nr:hypothetical protein BJ170DRAFT_499911 [Xylariales sp. AK1849]